jgi:hypothetical protein
VSLVGIASMGIVSLFQPDSPLAITAHGVNIAPSTAPGFHCSSRRRRLRRKRERATSSTRLFYQTPKVDRAWCPYCVTDAVTMLVTFALTLPETAKAFGVLRQRM